MIFKYIDVFYILPCEISKFYRVKLFYVYPFQIVIFPEFALYRIESV
jgi:hypothetical protein